MILLRVKNLDAFNRAFNRLTPATLEAMNRLVVQAAGALELEDGRQLRVETTVVETNIYHHTNANLLWDTVRTTLSRWLSQRAGPTWIFWHCDWAFERCRFQALPFDYRLQSD